MRLPSFFVKENSSLLCTSCTVLFCKPGPPLKHLLDKYVSVDMRNEVYALNPKGAPRANPFYMTQIQQQMELETVFGWTNRITAASALITETRSKRHRTGFRSRKHVIGHLESPYQNNLVALKAKGFKMPKQKYL